MRHALTGLGVSDVKAFYIWVAMAALEYTAEEAKAYAEAARMAIEARLATLPPESRPAFWEAVASIYRRGLEDSTHLTTHEPNRRAA